MGDAQFPTKNIEKSKQAEKKKSAASFIWVGTVAAWLVFGIIIVAIVVNRKEAVEDPRETKLVSNQNLSNTFVEITFEQSFFDLNEAPFQIGHMKNTSTPTSFKKIQVFCFPVRTKQIKSDLPKLWIGKRFHNEPSHQHASWQQLRTVDDAVERWQIEQ